MFRNWHVVISSKSNRSYDEKLKMFRNSTNSFLDETDQNLNLNFVAVDIFQTEDNRVITALKRVSH